MSSCPSCSRNIKIDESHYGTLYTCPQCQSVFFVGWDGQPENAAAPMADTAPTENFASPEAPAISNEEVIPQANDFISTPATSFPADDLSSPLNPIEPTGFELPSYEPTEASGKENFNDVLEFANAVEDKGLITYTLTIKGIDLSHLHQQLTDALTDPKFNWRVEEIMGQIQDGTLTLESLNAAKAAVLVQRLKFLPLEIHWRQNVLTS